MRLRDTLACHFERMERDKRYLSMLAMQHPAVYCNLIARIIPTQVAVDVTHHVIDLGAEIVAAHKTLADMRARVLAPDVIDHVPYAGAASPAPQLTHNVEPVADHPGRVRRKSAAAHTAPHAPDGDKRIPAHWHK